MALITILGLLFAISIPNLVGLTSVQKSSLYQVKDFIELTRLQAISEQRPLYIAFDSGNLEIDSRAAYATFASIDPHTDKTFAERSLRRISDWHFLPSGAQFVNGSAFETTNGETFRTLFDTSSRRSFDSHESSKSKNLPYLVFAPSGQILVPSIYDADSLYLGIADSGRHHLAPDCLAIEFYSGSCYAITD